MINVNTTDKTFKPTVEWMEQKYQEMNKLLFNGKLGQCNFAIFTSGKGSQGDVLGWFKITGKNIKVDRHNGRIFKYTSYDDIFVDKYNFYSICLPQIELNGNYTGTELSFLTTLVHEMCHYYTYMNGFAPKQGHGPEFKSIARYVTANANGMFTIQRLASAEQMEGFVLSDEMKEKKEKRLNNKKSKLNALISFKKSGQIRLTTTSKEPLIQIIINSHKDRDNKKVIQTNDINFIEYIFKLGYNINFSTWRYWDITDKNDILTQLNKSMKQEYINPNMDETKYNTKNIINEVLKEFIKTNTNNNDDSIDINPNMNLGLESPFEI